MPTLHVSRGVPILPNQAPPYLWASALLPGQRWHRSHRSWGLLTACQASASRGARAPGSSIFLSVPYLSAAYPAGRCEGLMRACRRSALGSQGEKCCLCARYDGAEGESRRGTQAGNWAQISLSHLWMEGSPNEHIVVGRHLTPHHVGVRPRFPAAC